MSRRTKVGVLASGGGTNLQAILDASQASRIDAEIVVVISDREGAGCLDRARSHGIDAVHIKVPKTGTEAWRAANEQIVAVLRDAQVELVAMAGYMRMISPSLLKAFPGAVMNIHPALLPSFPGTHGQGDANAHGVKLAGATVHFADEEFDRGPIIIQGVVPVQGDDTDDALAARILTVEHRIYPQAIQWFSQGRLRIEGRRVLLDGEPVSGTNSLIWPPIEWQ